MPTTLVLSHRRAVPLVLLGAVLGSAARVAIAEALPDWSFPAATLFVNLAGVLLVAMLWQSLRNRPESFTFLVVGVGGAATTFSALTIEAVTLVDEGSSLMAVGYLAASLMAGFVAALVGIRASGRR